jgi:carboxyl-terminal processing protease
VGQTTFGTGTVLLPMELSDGSMVLIGTEMWLTANGEVIWHEGVPPTIEVENEPGVQIELPFSFEGNEMSEEQLAALEDDQLLAAFDEISNQVQEAAN